jgi:hypothetical protein
VTFHVNAILPLVHRRPAQWVLLLVYGFEKTNPKLANRYHYAFLNYFMLTLKSWTWIFQTQQRTSLPSCGNKLGSELDCLAPIMPLLRPAQWFPLLQHLLCCLYFSIGCPASITGFVRIIIQVINIIWPILYTGVQLSGSRSVSTCFAFLFFRSC